MQTYGIHTNEEVLPGQKFWLCFQYDIEIRDISMVQVKEQNTDRTSVNILSEILFNGYCYTYTLLDLEKQ